MKKLTQIEFIEKANLKHNNKYDYSKVEYIGSKIKVEIICFKHGSFWQTPNDHLNKVAGCSKCKEENSSLLLKKNISDFIIQANQIHNNKYDYSLVKYVGNKTKVCIICPIHGEFWQRPDMHISRKNGCSKCRDKLVGNLFSYNTEQFIEKARQTHSDKYNYSLVEYKNSKDKVKIICNKHGLFLQAPAMHLSGNGCPKCKESKGEFIIRKWLEKNNIKFKTQKTFNGLRSTNKGNNKGSYYKFDFYLPDYNLCIEFDGIQHYKPFSFSSDISKETKNKNLEYNKYRDSIKTQYCKDNNIELLRIPYWKINNIEEILYDSIMKANNDGRSI